MGERMIIAERIEKLCREREISYYTLSLQSTVPISTLMNIIHGKSRNPGIFTILKICNGIGITITDFLDDEMFEEMNADE